MHTMARGVGGDGRGGLDSGIQSCSGSSVMDHGWLGLRGAEAKENGPSNGFGPVMPCDLNWFVPNFKVCLENYSRPSSLRDNFRQESFTDMYFYVIA